MITNGKQILRKKGFTLIETFVAITVLLVAVVGPLSLATKSLFAAIYARDQVVASYLAQDAVEYIRSKRDNNFLAGNSWLSGDLSLCISPKVCRVDSATDSIAECSSSECSGLLYNESTGFYGYDSGLPSSFVRSITLVPATGNADEYIISVLVSWETGVFERSFTAENHIFDWLP